MRLQPAKAWSSSVSDHRAVRVVDTLLRGAGQVMFQNNPVTGLLFVAGIWWGAARAGEWEVGLGAVVGLVVSTCTAWILGFDAQSRGQGIYGFNGILVGAALPSFLHVDARLWVYLVVGAAVSTVVMQAISNIFDTWGVTAMTAPFVITTWFLVLGAFAFANVGDASLPKAALPQPPSTPDYDFGVLTTVEILFKNVAQVFLIDNVVTGIIFVVALAVSSWAAAVASLLGSALALGTAVLLGASADPTESGLFGFSAVLTAIALGTVFYSPGWRVAAFAALGVIFTVIVQGALDAALDPIGIPTFTMPFVLATWLFLIPHEKFRPIHHDPRKRRFATQADTE